MNNIIRFDNKLNTATPRLLHLLHQTTSSSQAYNIIYTLGRRWGWEEDNNIHAQTSVCWRVPIPNIIITIVQYSRLREEAGHVGIFVIFSRHDWAAIAWDAHRYTYYILCTRNHNNGRKSLVRRVGTVCLCVRHISNARSRVGWTVANSAVRRRRRRVESKFDRSDKKIKNRNDFLNVFFFFIISIIPITAACDFYWVTVL